MMMHRVFALFFFSVSVSVSFSAVAAEFPEPYNTEPGDPSPMPAGEAAATATLPEGFRLEVFASEPEVQQPIAICFDEPGRLWVAECYTYAERPLRWDLELRDRIVVLADTSGDGKSDSRTVFWDEGKRLTSIAWERGGVWALCAPELLFIPDADGDLVPDGDPVVVLDGFDAELIGHNVVNGLKWGPDGWLYGRHGITATSRVGAPGAPESERTSLNTSIWRFQPERKVFEVVSHGGTNPWGLDWDKNGQLFYTNTVIGHLWHAIPGGYFERMFGAHLNRHAYELIQHTADHYHWDKGSEKWSDIREGISGKTSDLGGGHAHMGCLIYEGGVWPAQYQGKLFTCNLHGRRVNMERLDREGVGYVARHEPDFLMMKDPWFRGLDLVTGPDGQVWVNDWSDTGECHDNDGIHRTSGRIYRIVYEGADAGKPTTGRPGWLTQRRDPDFGRENIEALLASGDEPRIAMGVRWFAEDFGEDGGTAKRFLALAKDAPDGLVRLELASALQRIPLEERIPLASVLSQVVADADDRQQPLMIWYGISEAVPAFPEAAVELAIDSKLPTVSRLIARRLAEEIEENPDPVNDLLTKAAANADPGILSAVLTGIGEALGGWSQAPKPAVWESIVAAGNESDSPGLKDRIRELSVLFGDGRAREELLAIAANLEADPGARRSALVHLLRQPDVDLLPLLKKWVTDKVIAPEAVRGLALYEEKGLSAQILNFWTRNPIHRPVAIDTLVSRASYASDLLDAIEKGRIPPRAVSPFQARQIRSLEDETLNKRLGELWGEVNETSAEKKEEIAKWKSLLTEEVIGQADPVKGEVVFAQSCGACHQLYGKGGNFGPDLTGSDRHNLDYLLGNIINPNDVVPADYRLTVFTLKDARVVSGIVPEEDERSVSVQTPAGLVKIEAKEIQSRETLPLSLMPEGLLKAMPDEEVRDLIAYLMSR